MISSEANRAVYQCNGSTAVFNVTSVFYDPNDVTVIETVDATGVSTLLDINDDYTVTGGNGATGTVVPTAGAPAAGKHWTVYVDPARTQDVNLAEGDYSPAEVKERQWDETVLMVQRLKDRVDRAVRLPEGFYSAFDTQLPGLLPADATLIVNDTGDGLDVGPTLTSLLAAETAAAASAAAAAASQSAAASSAVSASNSATTATTQATASSNSATASATSATAAASSATAAAASAASMVAAIATWNSAVATLTNKTIAAGSNTITGIADANIAAGAAIAYSKLNLATSIVNADIAAGAAIATSKLAAATAIGYVDVGSSLTTLLAAKAALASPNFSGTPTIGGSNILTAANSANVTNKNFSDTTSFFYYFGDATIRARIDMSPSGAGANGILAFQIGGGATRTYTFPNASGNVAITGNTNTGDIAFSGAGAFVATAASPFYIRALVGNTYGLKIYSDAGNDVSRIINHYAQLTLGGYNTDILHIYGNALSDAVIVNQPNSGHALSIIGAVAHAANKNTLNVASSAAQVLGNALAYFQMGSGSSIVPVVYADNSGQGTALYALARATMASNNAVLSVSSSAAQTAGGSTALILGSMASASSTVPMVRLETNGTGDFLLCKNWSAVTQFQISSVGKMTAGASGGTELHNIWGAGMYWGNVVGGYFDIYRNEATGAIRITANNAMATGIHIEMYGLSASGGYANTLGVRVANSLALQVDANRNVIMGEAAIATSATNGFLYLESCAGTPTGTPTTVTGRNPLVWDSTNHILYTYSGGIWRSATGTTTRSALSVVGQVQTANATTNAQSGTSYFDMIVLASLTTTGRPVRIFLQPSTVGNAPYVQMAPTYNGWVGIDRDGTIIAEWPLAASEVIKPSVIDFTDTTATAAAHVYKLRGKNSNVSGQVQWGYVTLTAHEIA